METNANTILAGVNDLMNKLEEKMNLRINKNKNNIEQIDERVSYLEEAQFDVANNAQIIQYQKDLIEEKHTVFVSHAKDEDEAKLALEREQFKA